MSRVVGVTAVESDPLPLDLVRCSTFPLHIGGPKKCPSPTYLHPSVPGLSLREQVPVGFDPHLDWVGGRPTEKELCLPSKR